MATIIEEAIMEEVRQVSPEEQQEILEFIKQRRGAKQCMDNYEEDWLDSDFLRYAASEADETISLETVRKILSKIPGSLTEDFIAEREISNS